MTSPTSSTLTPLSTTPTTSLSPPSSNSPKTPQQPPRRHRLTSYHLPHATPLMSTASGAVKFTSRRKSIAVTPGRLRDVDTDSPERSGRRRDRDGDRSRPTGNIRKNFGGESSRESSTSSSSKNQRRSRRSEWRKSISYRKQLSQAELSELYSSTIKLSQENKINVRNTWSLNLIDYIGMLVKEGWGSHQGDDERGFHSSSLSSQESVTCLTNFQLAGVTLDAGVKIYCSRVDSVHTNAFKVLGGLSRSATGRRNSDNNDGSDNNNDDSDDDDEGGGRKTRRKRSGAVTLEANLDNITLKKVDNDYAVDPLFHKMSAAFDEGGAKGMLLNNLSITDKYELVFDSSTPADAIITRSNHDRENDENCVYDVSKFMERINISLELTPTFLRYYRGKMNNASESNPFAAADDAQSSPCDSSPVAGSSVADDFGFEYSAGEFENSDQIAGLPTSDEDLVFQRPSEGSNFAEIDDDDDPDAYGADSRVSTSTTASVARGAVDLLEAGAVFAPSAYSFFDATVLSSWAGPSHWKPTATSNRKQGIKGESKNRKPRGKTAMLLDFSSEAPPIDFSKLFARERSIKLSAAVLDSFKESKVTLPEDLGYRTEMLGQLFVKPSVSVFSQSMRAKQTRSAVDCADIGPVDNDGGSQWYDVDDSGPADFCCNEPVGGTECGMAGDETDLDLDMVPEPVRPEKLEINFASVAKKVDVQQLKTGLWSDLCGETDVLPERDSNVENHADKMPAASDLRKGATKSVQHIVRNMERVVPREALEEISFPYVFICLLHLANEKNLMIKSSKDHRDLIVSSGDTKGKGY